MAEKQKITIISNLEAKPEAIEEVKSILQEMILPTRKEPGCLRYQMYQSHTHPAKFTFIHEWETEEAMNAHILSGHFNQAAGKLQALLAGNPDFQAYMLVA